MGYLTIYRDWLLSNRVNDLEKRIEDLERPTSPVPQVEDRGQPSPYSQDRAPSGSRLA